MKRNSKKEETNKEFVNPKYEVEELEHPKKPKGNGHYKSYKEGYAAAKEGQAFADCPYELDEESKKLLLKRDRWLRGYEEYAFRKKTRKEILKARKKGFHLIGRTKGYGVGYVVFDNE